MLQHFCLLSRIVAAEKEERNWGDVCGFGWSVQFYAENFEVQGTESWMGDGGWRLDGGGVNFVCGAFNRFVVRFTLCLSINL